MIKKKDSFQSRKYFLNHRCFIISDSIYNKHLAVNMTSIKNRDSYDDSCILEPEDLNGYIKHASFIYYAKAIELERYIYLDQEVIEISDKLLKKFNRVLKRVFIYHKNTLNILISFNKYLYC